MFQQWDWLSIEDDCVGNALKFHCLERDLIKE
jgi:hypothetical protein